MTPIRSLIAVAALVLTPALAPAQTASPMLGPDLAGLGCPEGPVRIAVLGDSLADGLWGSFFRAFAPCANVEVLRRSTVSDGLAQTDADGWLARLADDGPLDLVVVQVGANDITNIREGTTRHVWGGDTWADAYSTRAADLAAGLKDIGTDVIWMGLPIVGQDRFEDSYRTITALQADAVTAAGVRFVDTHEPTTFGQGAFVMSAEVDGALRQIRVTDQVHFTETGYDLVAGLLRGDVERLFADRGRAVAIDALQLQ